MLTEIRAFIIKFMYHLQLLLPVESKRDLGPDEL